MPLLDLIEPVPFKCDNCGNPEWDPFASPYAQSDLPGRCQECGAWATNTMAGYTGIVELSEWDDPYWSREPNNAPVEPWPLS